MLGFKCFSRLHFHDGVFNALYLSIIFLFCRVCMLVMFGSSGAMVSMMESKVWVKGEVRTEVSADGSRFCRDAR